MHLRSVRGMRDLVAEAAFGRTAEHQHSTSALVDQHAGQFHEVLGRPKLGRAKRCAWIQTDHFFILTQAGELPDFVCQCLLCRRNE